MEIRMKFIRFALKKITFNGSDYLYVLFLPILNHRYNNFHVK